ncbi:MAG: hypothetical protein PHX43_05300 [Alphaproteobacteria bacterium]|nr:hypothetical protein [Alphaproteobacteria bacterium]
MTTPVAFQDEVKHIVAGVMGTVIAIYTKEDATYIDVRSADEDRIYYKSPAENWEVVRTQLEIEGATDE